MSGTVLGRARREDGLVWSVLYTADYRGTGVGPEDLDLLIDGLRTTRDAEVTALVKETDEGWKVSLRSRGAVDVGAIAVACGGVGHHNGRDAGKFLEPGAEQERLQGVGHDADLGGEILENPQ